MSITIIIINNTLLLLSNTIEQFSSFPPLPLDGISGGKSLNKMHWKQHLLVYNG